MSPRGVLRFTAIAVFSAMEALQAGGQAAKGPQTILFGAAYYEEYSPTDRLDEDVRMMKATGITVVRIAESTWGTLEPKPGVFDLATRIECSPPWTRPASRSSWEPRPMRFPLGSHASILRF